MENDIKNLYENIQKNHAEWTVEKIEQALRKILIKTKVIKCDHKSISESYDPITSTYKCIKCSECGVELPICPDCKKRKWLFSDYNMCGDCWGKIMEGQFVVDG